MPDPHPKARDKPSNDPGSPVSPGPRPDLEPPPAPPGILDHELVRCIGRGSYGEVWLARNVMGPWRAVKIVYRRSFDHDRPFERELEGIRRFEPISRSHPSQLNVLHVGRNDAAGCFYYVMELADPVEPPEAKGQKSEDRGPRTEGGGEEADGGVLTGDVRPVVSSEYGFIRQVCT